MKKFFHVMLCLSTALLVSGCWKKKEAEQSEKVAGTASRVEDHRMSEEHKATAAEEAQSFAEDGTPAGDPRKEEPVEKVEEKNASNADKTSMMMEKMGKTEQAKEEEDESKKKLMDKVASFFKKDKGMMDKGMVATKLGGRSSLNNFEVDTL